MRTISNELKSLLTNKNISGLTHKVLLYRRYWDSDTSSFLIEETGTDITSQLSNDSSNGKIKYALDTDEVNVWKLSNLTLIFENSRNQFYLGKSDGYFPSPYIIYGSKIEYYIGSPVLNDYVRYFTGYLTDSPNYRFDDGLVEFQALSRLDWLDNISAEGVSTSITNEEITKTDSTHCETVNASVGRITKIQKGTTLGGAIELKEGTDYSISQLNDHDNGAIIELESELLTGEKIFADYIYWEKDITIDALVSDLLDEADIDSNHRIIDNVVFENNVRVANNSVLTGAWTWLYQTTANTLTKNYTDINSNTSISLLSIESGTYGCNMSFGSVRFRITSMFTGGVVGATEVKISSSSSDEVKLLFYRPNPQSPYNIYVSFKSGSNIYLTTGVNNDYFYIGFTATSTIIYKNSTQIWSTTDGFSATYFTISSTRPTSYITLDNIASKYSSEPFDTAEDFISYPYCRFQNQNTSGSFAGFDKFMATVSIDNTPIPSILVRYGNSLADWTDFVDYTLSTSLTLNYDSIEFIIKNTATFGNNYELSDVALWSFQTSDILLGVCNLTDMSIMEALKELAAMAMYEIGFDADDKFFFRKRVKSSGLKELSDSQIIEVSAVEQDFDRLKTRITVGYGNYNKVVDCNTLGEEHPNNIDKYGTRIEEISSGQLLPADNVDLAYAIAPTRYAELSVLRTKLSMETIIDLELELGDYIRILHDNTLITNKNDSDYEKWQSLGIYYMKCKVVGINTDLKTKKTMLDLIDYTQEADEPIPA